jgi:4-hydroxybenzoate polyprenyltransferase
MRPRQWTKNVFVLSALIFDRQLNQPASVLHSLAGMSLFCLLSSCVYILNDLMDIEGDRIHPQKKNRPIASGQLPVSMAIASAAVIMVATLTLSFLLSFGFFIISLTYFITNLAYSKWLKHIPLVDVLVLASFYVLRVSSGVNLIHVERFSPWLYVVTTLLALYLGFGKRRTELMLLSENAGSHRRVLKGYTIPYLDQLIVILSSSTIIAYCLYTFSAPNLPDNHAMMLTVPFVIYGIFRYLFLIQVKETGGAPEEILLSDRPLQIAVILFGFAVLIIFYIL